MAKSVGLLKTFIDNPILFYVVLFIVAAFVQVIYVYLTPFERSITVAEKINYSSGKYMSNTLIDKEGNVYQATASWPILHFRAPEVWLSLEEGKTYTIRGNGIRVPILGLYPNIVGAVKPIE
jgi:hypothetical protein